MPYKGISDPKLPDYVKKKSSALRKIWVSAFNAAYKSSDGDEAYAFKVANAAVKKAAKKKKESIEFPENIPMATDEEFQKYEYLIEEMMNEVKGYNITENIITSLKEGTIDAEKRTADIVALKEGWSANGNYYSKEVAESLSALLVGRKKIFCNHTDEKKFGRDVLVWAATVQEAIGTDGKTQAKIRFTDNPASAWLFEEAKQNPEEVQFSIDAVARVHEGKAPDGRDGLIVDKFIRLNSLDIVDYAAAGGVVQRTYASKESSELSILKEAADTLKDYVAKYVERDKLQILMSCFIDMLYGLSWSVEAEDDKSKKEKIEDLVDEFLKEFSEIDVVKAFESKHNPKDGDNMEITLEEVKKHPEILEALKNELAESEAAKAKDKELTDLRDKVKEQDSELKAAKDTLQTKEKELADTKEALNQYKFKEELAEREHKVREAVKESSLGNFDDLPEYIQEDLKSKKDDESVKKAIQALEVLKGLDSGKVTDAGKTRPPEKPKKPDSSLADDPDAIARIFK